MQRTYEEQLDADMEWALSEGSRHFDCKSAVHETLQEIAESVAEKAAHAAQEAANKVKSVGEKVKK